MAIKYPARHTLHKLNTKEFLCDGSIQQSLLQHLNSNFKKNGKEYFSKNNTTINRLFDDDNTTFSGHYKIYSNIGQYYLKSINNKYAEKIRQANHIAKKLKEDGINSCPAVDGFPISFESDYHIFLHPWIKSNDYKISNEFLFLLGQEVGKIHKSLHKISTNSDKINHLSKSITDNNLFNLEENYNLLLNDDLSAYPKNKLIKNYTNESRVSFKNLQNCSLLHGDINKGNIIFSDEKIYFIDFEDCLMSHLPKSFEIAFILERFCLLTNTSDHQKLNMAKSLLKGYISEHPNLQLGRDYSFEYCLKWLTIRSLVILSQHDINTEKWVKIEWYKFIEIINLQKRKHILINKINNLADTLSQKAEQV